MTPEPGARLWRVKFARRSCICTAQGVVHRDMKPENILDDDKRRKLKSWTSGSRWTNRARRLTWSGLSSTIGTPDYMAPEQVSGRRGDARTDIYSLGHYSLRNADGRSAVLRATTCTT